MFQFTGAPLTRDQIVAVGDIGAVVNRFGASGDPSGNPLTTPGAATGYHTSADRNGSIPGQNAWNLVAALGVSRAPDNTLARASDRDTGGATFEIYTMNANGTGVTRLTNNSVNDGMPSWSPDGSKIVFDSERDGNSEIYVMNADGSNPTRLTNNPAGDFDPTWSPDGQQIAFVSERDFNREIYTMNADGSSQTNRSNNFAFDADPDWSPDGLHIAFVSDRTGNFDVYVMSPTGVNQNDLINNPAYFDTFPAWSPSGQHITFQSNRNGDMEVFQITGEIQVNLTNFPSATDGATMPWSPDGTKIAFTSDRDGNYEIYVMNANGTGQTRLTINAGIDGAPDWSP
jgi:Tol biopolymer transport system component